MPVVIKYFLSVLRSQKYATRSLRSLLSYFYDLSNSRKYFIHHWHNIIVHKPTYVHTLDMLTTKIDFYVHINDETNIHYTYRASSSDDYVLRGVN